MKVERKKYSVYLLMDLTKDWISLFSASVMPASLEASLSAVSLSMVLSKFQYTTKNTIAQKPPAAAIPVNGQIKFGSINAPETPSEIAEEMALLNKNKAMTRPLALSGALVYANS